MAVVAVGAQPQDRVLFDQLVAEAVEHLQHDLAGLNVVAVGRRRGSRRRRRRTGSRSRPGCPRPSLANSRRKSKLTRTTSFPIRLLLFFQGVRLGNGITLGGYLLLLEMPDAVRAALGAGALLVLALLDLLLVLVPAHHAAEGFYRGRHRSPVRPVPPPLPRLSVASALAFGFFFGLGLSASMACSISSLVTVLRSSSIWCMTFANF